MFTLSGGHVFPLYDGAVKADPPMPIIDVRHEQTAVFAAEATARLTRTPGLAVLTAGPGVTNGVSAVTTAHFNGSPLVVLAGRAPDGRWGQAASRSSIIRRCSRRSPSEPGPRTTPAEVGAGRRRRVHAGGRPASRPGLPGREPGGAVRPRRTASPALPRGSGARPRRRRARRRPRISRDRPAAGRAQPAGAGPRLRCLAGRRRGRRQDRGRAASGCRSSPTARAAASCLPGIRCWSPAPGPWRSAKPTW